MIWIARLLRRSRLDRDSQQHQLVVALLPDGSPSQRLYRNAQDGILHVSLASKHPLAEQSGAQREHRHEQD
jgi:hypothetical protein